MRRLHKPGYVGSGNTNDTAVVTFANKVVSLGGSVSGGRVTALNTLVGSLRSGGFFNALDGLWIAGENVQQWRVNLVNAVAMTETAGGTYTNDRGYAGDGVGGYWDTNLKASTCVNFQAASAMFGCYVRTSRVVGQAFIEVGTNFDATATALIPRFTDDKVYPNINNSSGPSSLLGGDVKGMWIVNQFGGIVTGWQGAVSKVSGANAPVGVSPSNFYIGSGKNSGGSAVNLPSTDQISLVCVGAGLANSTLVGNLNTIFVNYLTSIGAN